MSAHVELLRFNWKPSVIRLGLAALADAGPVARRVWIVRAGLPANHFSAALEEARRLGLLAIETPAEGLRLLVQPVEFWKERPLWSAEDFAQCWDGSGRPPLRRRMALATEAPGLADVLRLEGCAAALPNRIPVLPPESGGDEYRNPVLPTFRRKDVSDPERTTSKRDRNPDSHAEAEFGDGLRERVRLFVGERDWRKFWEHEEWQDIFDDAQRAKVLAGSLRYLQAGLRDGVQFRKNAGAALWEDYKRCLGREAARL